MDLRYARTRIFEESDQPILRIPLYPVRWITASLAQGAGWNFYASTKPPEEGPRITKGLLTWDEAAQWSAILISSISWEPSRGDFRHLLGWTGIGGVLLGIEREMIGLRGFLPGARHMHGRTQGGGWETGAER